MVPIKMSLVLHSSNRHNLIRLRCICPAPHPLQPQLAVPERVPTKNVANIDDSFDENSLAADTLTTYNNNMVNKPYGLSPMGPTVATNGPGSVTLPLILNQGSANMKLSNLSTISVTGTGAGTVTGLVEHSMDFLYQDHLMKLLDQILYLVVILEDYFLQDYQNHKVYYINNMQLLMIQLVIIFLLWKKMMKMMKMNKLQQKQKEKEAQEQELKRKQEQQQQQQQQKAAAKNNNNSGGGGKFFSLFGGGGNNKKQDNDAKVYKAHLGQRILLFMMKN